MRYVVDTHALVWHLTNDRRLGSQARRVLDDDSARLIVPSIVLAEAKYIAERKRVALTFKQILDAIVSSPNTSVFPLDVFAVEYMPEHFEIHDGIIVASALFCQEFFRDEIAILTNDRAITESGLVATLW